MMKQMTVAAILGGALVVGGAVWAADGWMGWFNKPEKAAAPAVLSPAAAKPVPGTANVAVVGNALDIQPNDRVVGSITAPVTIIEYASMTCNHCAHFATDVMPKVKKDFIESGKVKYVLRDLAWDNLAVGMAKVARCAPPSQFLPIADAFFKNQERIVTSNDALGEIKAVAKTFGLDDAKVEACVKDADLQAQIEASKDTALNTLGVRGTPTVFVNGQKVEKAGDYFELKKALDAAYAKVRPAR